MPWLKIIFIVLVIALSQIKTMAQATTSNDSTLIIHKVKVGENLYRISTMYGVFLEQIVAWNKLSSIHYIQIGQGIKIWQTQKDTLGLANNGGKTKIVDNEFTSKPINDTNSLIIYSVKPKETLYQIAVKYNLDINKILAWNNLKSANYIKAGQLLELYLNPTDSFKIIEQSIILKEAKNLPIVNKNIASPAAKMDSISVDKNKKTKSINPTNETDLSMSGTILAQRGEDFDSSGKVIISGYISSYYAYYTDSTSSNNFVQFPTSAARNNTFGINIVQLSFKYATYNFRSIATLHYGDIPSSSWSSTYNMLQEANVGFRLLKKCWLDVGYFRTFIGLESIQPRENIATSVATSTYFQPYFLSGAKFTWELSKKINLQLSTFNGFNSFVTSNNKKAIGFSGLWQLAPSISIALNSLYSSDLPDSTTIKSRFLHDLVIISRNKKWDIGLELNYYVQEKSLLVDMSKKAEIFSGMIVSKYKFNKKKGIYARYEYYSDANAIESNIYINKSKEKVGLEINGATLGIEIKPIANSYIRFESRWLHTLNDINPFYYNNANNNWRIESIFATGVWF